MINPVRHAIGAALATGALAGFVVAGGGARLAMRFVALADDREDFGSITSQGARVGEFTIDGTQFLLFGGAFVGVAWALVYVAVRRWLPVRTALRHASFAVIVSGFGLAFLVSDNQEDFMFVDVTATFLSFGVVLVLLALTISWCVERLAPARVHGSLRGGVCVGMVTVLAMGAGLDAVTRGLEIAP